MPVTSVIFVHVKLDKLHPHNLPQASLVTWPKVNSFLRLYSNFTSLFNPKIMQMSLKLNATSLLMFPLATAIVADDQNSPAKIN